MPNKNTLCLLRFKSMAKAVGDNKTRLSQNLATEKLTLVIELIAQFKAKKNDTYCKNKNPPFA